MVLRILTFLRWILDDEDVPILLLEAGHALDVGHGLQHAVPGASLLLHEGPRLLSAPSKLVWLARGAAIGLRTAHVLVEVLVVDVDVHTVRRLSLAAELVPLL